MAIFCKSYLKNAKMVTISVQFFPDLYDLGAQIFFWTVLYTIVYTSLQFETLGKVFCASNYAKTEIFKFTEIVIFYKFSAKFFIKRWTNNQKSLLWWFLSIHAVNTLFGYPKKLTESFKTHSEKIHSHKLSFHGSSIKMCEKTWYLKKKFSSQENCFHTFKNI